MAPYKKNPPTVAIGKPTLAVDVVIFGIDWRDDSLDVLLLRNESEQLAGHLALPGGPVGIKDTLEETAFRELKKKTGIRPTYLEQLYTFGDPERDPRERAVSVAYLALVRSHDHKVRAGSDAAEAYWFNVRSILDNPVKKIGSDKDGDMYKRALAFDHLEILQTALTRLEGKIRYTPIGLDLLPETFTLLELRRLYKIVLGREPDISNFRRKVAKFDFLVQAGENGKGKTLLCFDRKKYLSAVARGINFEI